MSQNVAERIEHALAVQIVRGQRPVGGLLPSVRALAAEFGVTVPTIQRAIAGLEAMRLVEVRHGRGITVLDPHGAGLSLLPVWFEAYRGEIEVLAPILADFLELRRVFTAHLLVKERSRLLAWGPALQVAAAAIPADVSPEALMEADLASTRAILEHTGHFAARALFHTVEQLIRAVPLLVCALYGDPAHHRRTLQAVAAALIAEAGDEERIARVIEAQASWDAAAVQRFRCLVATETA